MQRECLPAVEKWSRFVSAPSYRRTVSDVSMVVRIKRCDPLSSHMHDIRHYRWIHMMATTAPSSSSSSTMHVWQMICVWSTRNVRDVWGLCECASGMIVRMFDNIISLQKHAEYAKYICTGIGYFNCYDDCTWKLNIHCLFVRSFARL